MAQHHAPRDAPADGVELVVGEVDTERLAQRREELRVEFLSFAKLGGKSLLESPRRDVGVAGDAHKLSRDLGRREDEVHHASRDRRSWHAVVGCAGGVLGEGDAALGLDRRKPERAVRGRPRQNDADGATAEGTGQRAKEAVDRQRRTLRRVPRREAQPGVLEAQVKTRRDHVGMAGLDGHTVSDLAYRQRRFVAEQLRQDTLVGGGEVLYHDKRHGDVGG